VAGGAAPSASFTASPEDPRAGEAVNFNAATSRPEPGRTIRSYRWDFGDGSQRTTSSAVTSHTYVSPGTFSVTLVVTDDVGRQAVATGTLTIGTDAPTADFTYSPTGAAAGAPVNFNGNSSSAIAGRTIVSWSWDFPGGTPATSSSATPTTQFAFPGTYNVTLTVTDSAGKTGRVTKTVAVQ
jgi:PKD repeat protein